MLHFMLNKRQKKLHQTNKKLSWWEAIILQLKEFVYSLSPHWQMAQMLLPKPVIEVQPQAENE